MPTFTVRVDLRDAEIAHRETLVARMEAAGYSRQVVGANGAVYWLPESEFTCDRLATIQQVRDQAYALADAVRPRPCVLVTLGKRAWRGLTRVQTG